VGGRTRKNTEHRFHLRKPGAGAMGEKGKPRLRKRRPHTNTNVTVSEVGSYVRKLGYTNGRHTRMEDGVIASLVIRFVRDSIRGRVFGGGEERVG